MYYMSQYPENHKEYNSGVCLAYKILVTRIQNFTKKKDLKKIPLSNGWENARCFTLRCYI